VSVGSRWLVLVEDSPGEEVEGSIGDLSVVDGESDKRSEIVIGWLLVKSSSPEVSDASWNSVVSGSSLVSSDGGLHPVSELSVVGWFSSEDALDDLVEPLVSGY